MLEVLRSGRLSLGPMLERFEREFAAWLGVDDAVAVSAGTAALHLGVRALGWGAGDEVVTTPFSFVASANCLLYEGVEPVFCDVDPVTLNLDPDAAARGAWASGPPGCCRCTSSAIRPRCRSSRARRRARPRACSRTRARPWARSIRTGCGSAPAATCRPSPSTPTSS